jgi:hypothetical protein
MLASRTGSADHIALGVGEAAMNGMDRLKVGTGCAAIAVAPGKN